MLTISFANRFYTADGWINAYDVLDNPATFCVLVGGRGIGKTFGILKAVLDRGDKFIYLRRTQAQIDTIKLKELNPFKAVNDVCGTDIVSGSLGKYMGGFWHSNDRGEAVGNPVGLAVALSTVANIRGMSAEDYDIVIFDEFIPEHHERPIRAEETAFLNCMETFNRNREFQGKPPLKVVMLSNSNDLDSPILQAIGALRPLDEMIRKRQNYRTIAGGNVAIYRYLDSPITAKKKNTVLYQVSNNDDFSGMALDNEFSKANYENVNRQDMKQFQPLVSIGGMTVYEHKSERLYYVVDGVKSEVVYTLYPNSIAAFMRKYWYIKEAMLLLKVRYANAPVKIAFEKIWEKN